MVLVMLLEKCVSMFPRFLVLCGMSMMSGIAYRQALALTHSYPARLEVRQPQTLPPLPLLHGLDRSFFNRGRVSAPGENYS